MWCPKLGKVNLSSDTEVYKKKGTSDQKPSVLMVLIASTNPLTCFYHIKKFAKIFSSGKKNCSKGDKVSELRVFTVPVLKAGALMRERAGREYGSNSYVFPLPLLIRI